MIKSSKRAVAFFSAIVGVAAVADAQTPPTQVPGGQKPSTGFFDWDLPGIAGAPSSFTPSPFLNNNNAASVAAQLSAAQSQGKTLAVKVVEPLTNTAARNIFNQFNIKYVFCDFEEVDAVGRTRAIADLVLNSSRSSNAFIGNFNFYPKIAQDSTRPAAVNAGPGDVSFHGPHFNAQYTDIRGKTKTKTGKVMANESLYPASPDFRNPAQGNSNAPNIRSALFTLPIIRLTNVEKNLSSSDAHIPYVSRFNNWGNTALDTDGDASNGYQFVQNAATPSNGQLPSRGDFQAQILHYRMRGADSVHLFEANVSSVVGYGRNQARQDVDFGWRASNTANGIFSRKNFAFANLTTLIGDLGAGSGDSNPRSSEVAGAVWSGVYDKSGSTRRLAILLSNLSSVKKTIDLPNMVGGFRTVITKLSDPVDDDYVLLAGEHRTLTFTLGKDPSGKTVWKLNSNTPAFLDNNRNGVGIPEPATAGLIGVGALGLLARRRRTA